MTDDINGSYDATETGFEAFITQPHAERLAPGWTNTPNNSDAAP